MSTRIIIPNCPRFIDWRAAHDHLHAGTDCEKGQVTFRQALGALRTNADETDKMLKSMSARILDVEDKVYRSQSAGANAQAEFKKLRKKYARLREK